MNDTISFPRTAHKIDDQKADLTKSSLRQNRFSFITKLSTVLLSAVVLMSAEARTNEAVAQKVWAAKVEASDEDSNSVFDVKDLSGPAGKQLKVEIKLPPKNLLRRGSLTFYGLPDKIILSNGVRKSKVWIVPLGQANKLTLIAPRSYRGRFESAAILRKADGRVIEGQRFVISILSHNAKPKKKIVKKKAEPTQAEPAQTESQELALLPPKDLDSNASSRKVFKALSINPITTPSGNEERKEPAKIKPEPKPKPKKKVVQTISNELAETLLKKSQQLIKQGNIDAARETLKYMAEQGHAESAYLVATTHDPEEFKNFNAVGVEPDLEQAKYWYAKAAEMGYAKAVERVKEYAKAGL